MLFNVYSAGSWKPVPSAAAPISQAGNFSDKLQEQPQTLSPNNEKEQSERASSSNERDISRSRSGSREPGTGPDGSDCSEGSDEEEDSTSPVKTLSKRQRSSSGSASPRMQKKQLSKSRSPTERRKPSRPTSSPRRSTSKTTSRRKQSRFVVYVDTSILHHESVRLLEDVRIFCKVLNI